MHPQIAALVTTQNKDPSFTRPVSPILPALHSETIPICCKITLREGSSVLDTGEEIAVQAINLSTLQHGFIAKAFVLGWSRHPIGCIVFLVICSRRCRSVLVRELQSGSAEGKVPGLRAKGALLAARCAEDKLNRRLKKLIPHPISVQILWMSSTSAMHQQDLMHIVAERLEAWHCGNTISPFL